MVTWKEGGLKMTVNDLLKRVPKEDYDKMIIFSDGVGWSNINVDNKSNDVVITLADNVMFSDGE